MGICFPSKQYIEDNKNDQPRSSFKDNPIHKVNYGGKCFLLTNEGPEYKVERRESFGQAAKDHTE